MPVLAQFSGIVPRKAWHTLEPTEATIAHNAKLRNGKLEAWRETKSVGMGVQDAKTLYWYGCCPLTWDTCVDVAEYVVDYGRIFLTGRVDQPETAVVDKTTCAPTYFFLGVPNPTTILSITATETDGRDCSARSYVYTFVNIFGEESAPSPVSRQITVEDGTAVTVTGFETPPDGYGITEIWLYRTATGYRDYNVKEQEPLTDYLKVAEFAVGTTTYTDTILEKNLGPALSTREYRVPPKKLRHISYLRGTGILTGVTDNMVHFSAPYLPYNWPAEYDLTLPYNIVNAVSVGSNYFVSTDSYPYVITGDGACEARKCRNVEDVDVPLPDISCGYSNSAIATPFGMVYSSKDGLVLVASNATFRIITSKWFSSDDWVKIRPDTVRLAYWRGYIFCVTDVVTFLLEIDGETYSDMRLGELVTLSDRPVDLMTNSAGELTLLGEDRLIRQWNAGDTLRPYHWESRELDFGGESSPTAAKIRTQGTTFTLLTRWDDVSYSRYVSSEKPFRLGRLGRHLNYRIRLQGTGAVDFLALGMADLLVNRGQ